MTCIIIRVRPGIRGVIKEFNETWADELGYQVELVGWEETISGYGRPQRLINQDVDRCDLFLGMMWKRWGTPPDTEGKFTSGFHEEFERSIKRRKESGKPEISLFFKEIEEEFLVDRGPDLNKVLEFRDRIISEKSILYQNFSTMREIEALIRKCISHYVRLRCILDFKSFPFLIFITMTSLEMTIPHKLASLARSKFRSKLRLSLNNLEKIPFPDLASSCT